MSKGSKDLIAKRASIKGRLTIFKQYLDTVQKSPAPTPIEIAELSIKLHQFETLMETFDELQTRIEVLNCDNMEFETNERDLVENNFVSAIALARAIVARHNSVNPSPDANESLQSQSASNNNQQGFKLPQIDIAKFEGAYFEWLSFRDTYLSLIHKNENIQTIHKFHYLLSYLRGDAARVVSNIEVSQANYENAWRLLCDRYDNKKQLINFHLNSLLNTESIQRESCRALRYLIDHVNKNLRALQSLGQPTDKWDIIIIHIIASKLDSTTLLKWEEYRNTLSADVPTLQDFDKFLSNRADVLELLKQKNTVNNNATKSQYTNSRSAMPMQFNSNRHVQSFPSLDSEAPGTSTTTLVCTYCNGSHRVYDCQSFLAKGVEDRINEALKRKLCLNCLRPGHRTRMCRVGPCNSCKKRHNTLLHRPVQPNEPTTANESLANNTLTTDCNFSNVNKQIILSTAIIDIFNPQTRQTESVRALLDCGSQSSYMTVSLKEKLCLQSHKTNVKIIGIGNNTSHCVESCVAQINSKESDFQATLTFMLLPTLTSYIPKYKINTETFNIPTSVRLADPSFDRPAPVDVILGADIFWDILGSHQINLGANSPQLRSSQLGWLIAGPSTNTNTNTKSNLHDNTTFMNFSSSLSNLDAQLARFWECESLPSEKAPGLSESERECEKHFMTHTKRLSTGHFSVRLPLIDNPDCLGDSYPTAKKRFFNLEKRFRKQPELKQSYVEFINEYKALGHCSVSEVARPSPSYFLCHHPVLRMDSESTKLRVVFDGSLRTSSGVSLNDLQLTGPSNLQDSLFSILLRFRQHKYILTGDVEKMFRCVLLDEKDRNLQLILWRENEYSPLQTIKLNTVTYGCTSSSYLSIRCLWQLGEECTDDVSKRTIQRDFYCDDLITGADSTEELTRILNSVTAALRLGCFNLRKFRSNEPSIFTQSNLNLSDNLCLSHSSSALGLEWNPNTDQIHVSVDISSPNDDNKVTKRSILSSSFRIFDPLGLISPCTVIPKLLMQKLWKEKLTWDEPVPSQLKKEWVSFRSSVSALSSLQVQRLVLSDSPSTIELHSFCDASLTAYGACVYLRSIDKDGQVKVQLLCAKSKIAPIKPTTIPRLELFGALLAARLSKTVTVSLRCKIDRRYHWCDSSVVLGWLRSSPSKLQPFVGTRVDAITELTEVSSWRHVPTALNPADLISRGVSPDSLQGCNIWWSGPPYLYQSETHWPSSPNDYEEHDLTEDSRALHSQLSDSQEQHEPLVNFERFSKLTTLKRTIAYVQRAVKVFAHKPVDKGPLTLDELNNAFYFACKSVQHQCFAKEYDTLMKGQPLSPKSNLLKYSPFLDENKLLRVGGRLNDSSYNFEKKNPILLHGTHHLTKLIFAYEHIKNMHAGPQLLLACVREYVWPINGRHVARRTTHKCVICTRLRGKTFQPIMGNIPNQRVSADFPFVTVGIDFAGPFLTINKKGRGARTVKSYMCLFVCLRYKCIHLEAVSDLTKDAFLSTLRRFIARRGKPREIFCDNGKNFVGAARDIGTFIKASQSSVSGFATEEGIKFVFSPTHAPHFGGIWEAGVKSAKFHMKRVIGNTFLTFEELSTLLAQVEAILNSRPLCPLSPSPDDFHFLSPGHFLLGRPLTSLPAPALEDSNPSRLKRHQRLEQIRQHFWRRWQKECIAEMQQRTKWRTNYSSLKIGDLVLLQEENLSPLCWRLGRVVRLFHGRDNVTRVADIKTANGGTFRRPLVKICPLFPE